MNYPANSVDQLYRQIPEIYRERDKSTARDPSGDKHLWKFLDALGSVLDQTRHSLEQNYDDNFPDIPDNGDRCQDWLLPYFADLLAVNLQSPYPDGQRAEVSNSVRWAQRKGTLLTVEEIVEAIAQTEGEIQEGWKRVATTARIGDPLLSAMAMGEDAARPPDTNHTASNVTSQTISRHPGIPAVTPDFRQISRAVKTVAGSPNSKSTTFGWNGNIWPADDPANYTDDITHPDPVFWRQANPNNAPCFPGSYEDVSRRTVDIRSPGRNEGLYHPKNLIIYLPTPYGFCTPNPRSFNWKADLSSAQISPAEVDPSKLSDFVSRYEIDENTILYKNETSEAIEIANSFILTEDKHVIFEKIRFRGKVTVQKGQLEFIRCAIATVQSTIVPNPTDFEAEVKLKDCLVDTIKANLNAVQLEYVTVLSDISCKRIMASDCIFADTIARFNGDDCVRFSRVPEKYFRFMPVISRKNGITTRPVDFITNVYGDEGCGVLQQFAHADLCQGAEDGGELGAYHAWRYCSQLVALDAKLRDYLPVGIEPVLIRDKQFVCAPPDVISGP